MKKTMMVVAVLAMAALIAAPAMAAQYYETFDGMSGNLNGQGGWLGGTGSQIVIEDGSAKLTYDDAYRGTMLTMSDLDIGGEVIYFKVDVYAGGTGTQGNAFDILVNDATGKNFARWYGAWNTERPRIGGFGQVLGTQTLVADEWNQLMVVIDTVVQTSTFYLNGANLGYLTYATNQPAIGESVGQIRMGFQNSTSAQNGSYKYYDNIYVGTTLDPIIEPIVPEPSSFMALGMFGLGALGYIKRRRA